MYDGNSNSVTVTGLLSNTSYIFSVYEYNGATNCEYNYLINGTTNSSTVTSSFHGKFIDDKIKEQFFRHTGTPLKGLLG